MIRLESPWSSRDQSSSSAAFWPWSSSSGWRCDMGTFALTGGLLLVFVGLVVALSTVGVITRERSQVQRSLSAIEDYRSLPAELLDRPFKERVLKPGLARLVKVGKLLTPSSQLLRIRRRLEEAGTPDNWDVDRVLAYKVVGLGAGVLLGIVLGLVIGAQPVQIAVITLGTALLGYFVP